MMKLPSNIKNIYSKTFLVLLGLSFLILSSCRIGKCRIKPLYGVVSNYKQADLTSNFSASKKNIRL